MSCGVSHSRGLDPSLLWLWCRPAAAALIQPLVWEPPHAVGAALKGKKKKDDVLKLDYSNGCTSNSEGTQNHPTYM